jgi:hypothetical protein
LGRQHPFEYQLLDSGGGLREINIAFGVSRDVMARSQNAWRLDRAHDIERLAINDGNAFVGLARSTTSRDDCLLCCGRGSGLAGTLVPLQDSDPSRRNTSFPPIKREFLVLQFRSKIETHPAVIVTAG